MYKVEIFTDQFAFASVCMIDSDSVTIEQDFIAYDSFKVKTPLIACEKGYLVHITDEDNNYIADGTVGDVKPGDEEQEITVRPLNALFDSEVYYTAVSDCISWLATQIQATYMSNADTLQNRPISLTYTQAASDLPLTGFNLHDTVNILSVMISALKTYGVVTQSRLDLVNKRFTINIYQQTETKVLEASLENVLTKTVTIGDSYGSTNKLIIRETQDTGSGITVLGSTSFYRHPDGTIDTTNSDRIAPVFYKIESLQIQSDQTQADWDAAALARAKEVLTPSKYDDEIVLQYDKDDLLARPMDLLIGTLTTIYLEGDTYESILTGRRIAGQKVTLTFGVTRAELTKKLSMERRETQTFESTVQAVMSNVAAQYPSSAAIASTYLAKTDAASTYVAKAGGTMTGQLLTSWGTSVANGSHSYETETVVSLIASVRYSSGAMGSVNISAAYTYGNNTIAAGWYNYLYIPHRTGGSSGAAVDDGTDYGTLVLFGMFGQTCYVLTQNGGSVVRLGAITLT